MKILAEVIMKQRFGFSGLANACEQFARRFGQCLRW